MQGEASLKGFHMGKGLFTPTTGEFESICATVDETHNCRFLTADQAAEFLGGLNSRTVSRWAREAYLPSYPIGEGKRRLWRFLESDLKQWMLSRRTGQSTDIHGCEYTTRSHRCSHKETP